MRKVSRWITFKNKSFWILGLMLVVGQVTPATAEESYPWCVQGGSLHCYYLNREQCEQTVDYHGFCVANPDYGAGRTAFSGQ
jgi:hypothetical protein